MSTSTTKKKPAGINPAGSTNDAPAKASAEILDFAAAYPEPGFVGELRAMGFRLMPLPAGAKKPPPAGYPTNGVDYVIPEGRNAAIDTGHFWDGGALLVLDVDEGQGKHGGESLRSLEAAHDALPRTLTTITPTGGKHLFFRVPRAVRSSAGTLGKNLDVRSQSAYVVAPGSTVKAGTYRFGGQEHRPAGSVVAAGTHPPIADAPAWLVELCGQPRERSTEPFKPLEGYAAEVATEKARAYLVNDAPAAVEGDAGDLTTFSVAARVRDFGVSPDECFELMLEHWNERCSPPWSPTELERKVRNAYDYAKGAAGNANAAAIFDPVEQSSEARPVSITGGENAAWRRPMFAVDLRGFDTAPDRAQVFHIERIIPAGLVTLLGGHGGAGKSILALSMAAHFAAGEPVFGLSVTGGPALYVSLEDEHEWVRHRLRRIAETFGLNAKAIAANLRIVDGTAAGALMREDGRFGSSLSETAAMQELRALTGDASLIFIDNASDAFDGNENARAQVRTFVRRLATIGRDDAAVVLLAHIDKAAARGGANGNSYSGSTAWHNSTRSRLVLAAVKDTSGRFAELRHEKFSRTTPIPPMRLEWSPGGVLVPAVAGAHDNEDDAAEVLAAIEAANHDGVSIPISRNGPATAQHMLERFPELPDRLRGAAGRPAFWAALTALQRSGRVKVENYRNSQRKQRERFVPAAQVCAGSAPVWN